MYCLNDDCSVCEENWADEFDSIVDMNAEPDSLDKEKAIFIEDDEGIDDDEISEDEIDDLDLWNKVSRRCIMKIKKVGMTSTFHDIFF